MRIKDYVQAIRNKFGRVPRIGFFGIGVSTLSLLREAIGCECDIILRSDSEPPGSILPKLPITTRILTGGCAMSELSEDALFLSPSVRRERRHELLAAQSRGLVLISDAELFFLDSPQGVYAVSGSDGKSTTATLAHALLSEEYPTAALVGNIGTAFSSAPESASVYVAELSSFQLRYMTPHTEAAIITSVTENHLDWHDNFDEYISVKLSLLEHTDRAVLTADDEICARYLSDNRVFATYSMRLGYCELRRLYRADLYVTLESGHICINGERTLSISDVSRREWYNLLNLMGAICLTSGHYSREHLRRVASEFHGLAHRCECFFRANGKEYIDSSIDTTPSRTLATLAALDRPVSIILGGRGKHLPLGELCCALKKYAVRIALYGEAGAEYYDELREAGITDSVPTALFPLLRGAVDHADGCESVSTVLLSPAATGYGEFRSYAERGDAFKKYIKDKHK